MSKARHQGPLTLALVLGAASLLVASGCTNDVRDGSGVGAGGVVPEESPLTFAQRVAHTDVIKAVTASKGITNAVVLAGVANHETNLVQCFDDAPWHCPGPASSSCGGRPVLAGSGDGPCAVEQGGLGMFQLDSGTYAQTVAQHGRGVLELDGNTDVGADFILYKVEICSMTPVFASHDDVVQWVNGAVPGTHDFDVFMDAMASCYNGCSVGVCGQTLHDQRMRGYRDATLALLDEMGPDYWAPASIDPEPQPDPSTVSCGDLAASSGFGDGGCEWNGNEACYGTGVAASDCDRCCDLMALPDPSSMSCGDFAAQVGWTNASCEWNGNGACHGTGAPTNDCDACCDADAPMPSTMSCGDYARAMGWQTAYCEWNGNGACADTGGPATNDCDACCHIR